MIRSLFALCLELGTDAPMCINTWQRLVQSLRTCGSNKVSNNNKRNGWVGTCYGAGGIAGGHS